MQNRAFLKVSPVENVSFFQKEMFEGSYLSSYGDYYKRKRALGKKANTAIIATARLMARICWQLLTEKRAYASFPPAQKLQGRPEVKPQASSGWVKERKDFAMPKETFPSRSE